MVGVCAHSQVGIRGIRYKTTSGASKRENNKKNDFLLMKPGVLGDSGSKPWLFFGLIL